MRRFERLTRTGQLDRAWVELELIPLAESLREKVDDGQPLRGRSLYLLFYEPSLLTRTSFERAMGLLGGTPYFTEDASQFFPVTTPDYIENIIANLAAMHMDMVVLRSSDQGVMDRAEEEAEAQSMPLINGGSLEDHPTQALTDLYTLKREIGEVDGSRIAVVGRIDHRNVSALLRGLAMYEGVTVTQVPFSGQADPDVGLRVRGAGSHLRDGHDGLPRGGRRDLSERPPHRRPCPATEVAGRLQPAHRRGVHGQAQARLRDIRPDAAQRRLRHPRQRPPTGELPPGGELPVRPNGALENYAGVRGYVPYLRDSLNRSAELRVPSPVVGEG